MPTAAAMHASLSGDTPAYRADAADDPEHVLLVHQACSGQEVGEGALHSDGYLLRQRRISSRGYRVEKSKDRADYLATE